MAAAASPLDLGLPWPDWRLGQRRAISAALRTPRRFLVLQAPTGTGKTAIALGLARKSGTRTVVLTSTKGLQDQYAQVGARVVTDMRGMRNYPCHAAQDEFATLFARTGTVTCDDGPCKVDRRCSLKDDGCAYFDTVRRGLASPLVVTNYAYWLAQRLHGKGLGYVSRLICDEAHDAADQLAAAHELRVPDAELKHTRLPRTIRQWRAWAASELGQVLTQDADIGRAIRARTRRERLQAMVNMTDDWCVAHEYGAYVFAPVDVRPMMPALFGQTPAVVLMSATITPATLSVLGLEPHEVEVYAMPMRFPLERRPVWLVPGGRIDHRSERDPEATQRWIDTLDTIIERRLDRKGIVHTVSYRRQQQVLEGSRFADRMIAPGNAGDLASAIASFKAAGPGAVLVSPSVVTGFDFPYRDAEYQVLVKVPFPNTQSPITKARVKTIPHYREVVTMQQIVQATGRVMRAEDDQGETFILDEHARWFLTGAQEFAPSWFLDAVQITRRIPAPPPCLPLTAGLQTEE